MSDVRVIHGDMREQLLALLAEGVRVQSIVTDPPYHLTAQGKGGRSNLEQPSDKDLSRVNAGNFRRLAGGFMGKAWDGGDIAFQPATWRLCHDLLPPGGHLLAFAGDRTYHRLATAIEDAGFEIRQTIAFLYGSGFPKGLNVVTQLVKLALWQSKDHVLRAAQASASIQVKSEKAKAPIAVALARILPAGALALLTEIGGEVALHVPMDTWPSEWMAHIGLNTTSSLSDSLDDVCSNTSKCITSTASERITDQGTCDWLIGLHTSATTTRCSVTLPNGCEWPALSAASNLNGSNESRKSILIVTALGSAGWNPVARFSGFNVALKPAMELICVARKPLQGTVAANVLAHGTGALNIDGCRIGTGESRRSSTGGMGNKANPIYGVFADSEVEDIETTLGRWPANVVHDGSDEVVKAFPETQSGTRGAGSYGGMGFHGAGKWEMPEINGDSGSAARFFYSAKADAADRLGSVHPTVKPVDLMRWLVRLVTPPNGTVLDPFAGSGTTGMACMAEGFDCILVEAEAEYVADIRQRIAHVHGIDLPLFSGVML